MANIEIYGEGGGKKGGGSAPIEEDDTLASKQTLKVLYAISNGPVAALDEIYVNKLKLTTDTDGKPNIPGVYPAFRPGDIANSVIKGFTNVENNSNTSVPILVKKGTPALISIPGDKDRVRLTFVIERLYQIDDDGNITKYSVEFTINSSLSQSNFLPETAQTVTKAGKASGTYPFDVVISKPADTAGVSSAAPWYVKVIRETDDDGTEVKRQKYSTTSIAAITEITDVKLTYDTTALVGMTFTKAKRLGGQYPDLIFKVKGIRVPIPSMAFYTPETGVYTGNWDLVSEANVGYPSANPAWQILYLLSNPDFGLGIARENIDIGAFYELAKYCDEPIPVYTAVKGADGTWSTAQTGTRRRYELHNQFKQREQAQQFLAYFYSAAIARPTITKEGLHSVVWDRSRTPSILVTNSNVIDGIFNYSSNSLEERYSFVNAIYNDVNELGKTTTVTIPMGLEEDWEVEEQAIYNRYGFKSLDLPLVGCYSRDQAVVKARWALYRNSILTSTLSFSTLFEGLSYEIGDIIKVMDSFRNPTVCHGRISQFNAEGKELVLDRTITLTAGTIYTIQYYGLDSGVTSIIKRKVVTETASTYSTNSITFVGLWKEPIPEAVFMITSEDQPGTLWEIIGLSYDDDSKQISVSCVQYSDELYDYMYRSIKESTTGLYKAISSKVYDSPAVENIVITSPEIEGYRKILITWEWFYNADAKDKYTAMQTAYNTAVAAGDTTLPTVPYIYNEHSPEYAVHYRHIASGDSYTLIDNITTMSVEIADPKEGDYEFVIYAINGRSLPSNPTKVTYTYVLPDVLAKVIEFTNIPINEWASQKVAIAKRYEVELIKVTAPCRVRLYKEVKTSIDTEIPLTEQERPFTDEYIVIPRLDVDTKPFLDIDFSEEGTYDVNAVKSKIKLSNPDSLNYTTTPLYNNKTTVLVTNKSDTPSITVTIWYRVLQ